METTVITLLTLATLTANAAKESFICNGKECTKRDAIVMLAKDNNAKVLRVQEVELSDKATIKVKK